MSLKAWWAGMITVVVVVMLQTTLGLADPEIMPVDQVKKGMHGIGKTVVSGTDIEEFAVEVLGVMKNKGPSGDLILVKVSGDVIDRSGGIAEGMSGSPVYIDGKLIGAIAYGWPLNDHTVGMITPIADMLALWQLPDKSKTAQLLAPVGQQQDLTPQVTPLMATGFSPAALEMLKDRLTPLHLVPCEVGEASGDINYGQLEPGSSVAVEVIRGDVSLGAIGTVTCTEGNKVLAFGHPFLNSGFGGFFLSNAYIFTTIPALDNSFKVGVAGLPLGIINQDRGAGIAGELDRFPHILPLRIRVTDNTLGRVRDSEAQIVQNEQLAPTLASATVMSIIDKTLDRTGAGTATVMCEITAPDMPTPTFKRVNMFYSPSNISLTAVSEIQEVLTLLAANQFQSVDVLDVNVTVTVDADRHTATIMKAAADVQTAKPGDKINITVSVKPYRGDTEVITLPYTIPKDQAVGPMTLEVRGGGVLPLVQLLLAQQQATVEDVRQQLEKQKAMNFADLLKELAQRDHNNDIVIEVLSNKVATDQPDKKEPAKLDTTLTPNKETTAKDVKTANTVEDNVAANQENRSTVSTQYIIESDTQVMLQIAK
jgi:hypothetical protein